MNHGQFRTIFAQEPDFIAKKAGKDGNGGDDDDKEVIQGMDINDTEERTFTLMDLIFQIDAHLTAISERD